MFIRIVLFEVIILNILYISPMKSKVCGYTKNNNDVLIFLRSSLLSSQLVSHYGEFCKDITKNYSENLAPYNI